MTITYKAPYTEWSHTFSIAAQGAGTFIVMEIAPPPGLRLVVQHFEGNQTATVAFRVGVYAATQITAGGAAEPVTLQWNPPGFIQMARRGTRADVGLFGAILAPGFRTPYTTKWVVDSIGDQRLSVIAQTANDLALVTLKGLLIANEDDLQGHVVL